MEYEAVIGLEIHVQLNSAAKMFCDCPNRPGDEPNKNTCPICLWLPGYIPKFSQEALEKAALVCLVLNCHLERQSAFDQKVYYYPDLPKGYQLSQAHQPLAKSGWLDIAGEDGRPKRLRIRKIHMEEDVARLVHETEGRTPISLVDFNRAGTPLVEIVTEPDMRGPQEAMEFVRTLRTQIRYVGSSECSLEQGSMRVDANVSLRPRGSNQLNTKVEIKNMNSIRNLGEAIAYETSRQMGSLQSGEAITLHTRLWDAEKRLTVPMRGKFEGPCVPDPSVAQILISDELLNDLRSRLPEMPQPKTERFIKQYGLAEEEAMLMSSERDVSEYFEAVVKRNISPRTATHWLAAQMLPALKERNESLRDTPVSPERLASLLAMLEKDEVNANSAKEVLTRLFDSDQTPEAIVEQYGFKQVSGASELEELVDQVLAANPSAVNNFRSGQAKALSFLIGQAMQASQGKANPKRIREILMARLI
ncbi:MAG: Asp-tRNA(Asn)/Glu-tRNA(Gln) amidotransferase subunit GatB [Deltaproteobacteria bacterium]|nr:Asp-tRNA(Asn)/Glu-tRNA(Gln) amidotransferase subunit GatB [Deltaproteobacteria bacterium]